MVLGDETHSLPKVDAKAWIDGSVDRSLNLMALKKRPLQTRWALQSSVPAAFKVSGPLRRSDGNRYSNAVNLLRCPELLKDKNTENLRLL